MKTLHQQAYDRLTSMQAFGDSKRADMEYDRDHEDRTAFKKIYCFSAYETYWKHIKYFLRWIRREHPEVTELADARRYVNDWLYARVEETNDHGDHLSAWTISTEAAALNKLYQINPDDPDRFTPPKRRRQDIKRSRVDAVRDNNFSETNNAALVAFCKGTGLRRSGCAAVRGRDLMTREEVCEAIDKYPSLCADVRSMVHEYRVRTRATSDHAASDHSAAARQRRQKSKVSIFF